MCRAVEETLHSIALSPQPCLVDGLVVYTPATACDAGVYVIRFSKHIAETLCALSRVVLGYSEPSGPRCKPMKMVRIIPTLDRLLFGMLRVAQRSSECTLWERLLQGGNLQLQRLLQVQILGGISYCRYGECMLVGRTNDGPTKASGERRPQLKLDVCARAGRQGVKLTYYQLHLRPNLCCWLSHSA